jgi:ferredoxin
MSRSSLGRPGLVRWRFSENKPMPIRLSVNTAKCQSYRRCLAVAPAVFGIGKDGKAEVLHASDAPRDIGLKAARSCPYRAITAVDEDSGEQLFPPVRSPTDNQG